MYKKSSPCQAFLLAAAYLGVASLPLNAADFTISSVSGNWEVINVSNSVDDLTISEPAAGQIRFSAPGRTFSVNGGPDLLASSGDLSSAGCTLLHVDVAGGDDIISIEAFAAALPSLDLDGGTGSDALEIMGSVHFAANASLMANFQDDAAVPGIDSCFLDQNLTVETSGTGSITVKCSREIWLRTGSRMTTVDGGITLESNQQAVPTPQPFFGVGIVGAMVQSTGMGNIRISGKGGNAGNLTPGVLIQDGGSIRGGVAGASVTVQGRGGVSPANPGNNVGVYLTGATTVVTSSGANVEVIGHGGGAATSSSSYGLLLTTGAQIAASGTGNVSASGTGGAGSGASHIGVYLLGNSTIIASASGSVNVTGQGGGSGTSANSYGIYLETGGRISSTGLGKVAVTGTGGTSTGTGNYGIFMVGSGASMLSAGGDLEITGYAGNGTAGNARGIQLQNNASLAASGAGNVLVRAVGGAQAGAGNHGLRLVFAGNITAVDGDISLLTTAGGGSTVGLSISNAGGAGAKLQTTGTGNISITTDSLAIDSSGADISASSRRVSIYPESTNVAVNLGTASDTLPNTLGLADAELDRITAGSLILGAADRGRVLVTAAISRPATTQVTLIAAGNVEFQGGTFHTAGGSLNLAAGAALIPSSSGVDATASSVNLTGTTRLAIDINGTAVDTQATQLRTPGQPTLANAALQISGSHVPLAGQAFTIVNNQGALPVLGNFANLAEGALTKFNGVEMKISYQGGDGNDVVLTPEINLRVESFSLTPRPAAGEQVQVTIHASPAAVGMELVLQCSTDLVQWQPLATAIANAAGQVDFNLNQPTSAERRFYRVAKN